MIALATAGDLLSLLAQHPPLAMLAVMLTAAVVAARS
jgi:hypothetical protein